MKKILRFRVATAIALCVAVSSIPGCAVGPGMDGGIVGTGNRVSCDPRMNKDGTPAPLPEECNRDRETPR